MNVSGAMLCYNVTPRQGGRGVPSISTIRLETISKFFPKVFLRYTLRYTLGPFMYILRVYSSSLSRNRELCIAFIFLFKERKKIQRDTKRLFLSFL